MKPLTAEEAVELEILRNEEADLERKIKDQRPLVYIMVQNTILLSGIKKRIGELTMGRMETV